MVTRSHLQLVQPADRGDPARARLLAAAGAQHALVSRALDYAQTHSGGPTLERGQLPLTHVVEVARTLAELNLGADSLSAAVLHRAYEASADAARDIRARFGAAVAELCEGAARMGQLSALSSRERASAKGEQHSAQLEALRKMLLAMVQDVRVVLIELADHLQDLRFALRSEDNAACRATAEATRDIFAPLANRLGVWHVKWELEDLAFRILEPDMYRE